VARGLLDALIAASTVLPWNTTATDRGARSTAAGAMPAATLEACAKSDAVLLAASGAPLATNSLPRAHAPEKRFSPARWPELFANLRPVKIIRLWPGAAAFRPK